MAVALPVTENLTITCGVDRVSADFTESERTILTMIAPHLLAAIRNAQIFGQLQDERMLLQTAVEAFAQGIVIFYSCGHIRFISDIAVKFIEKYFADERPNAGFLPEKLRSYVENYNSIFAGGGEFFLSPPAFVIKQKVGNLRVRLSFSSMTREMTLLLEEQENLSPANFLALGLTKREAEVLFWMTRGKTKAEIGTLLYISPRTVHKHAEHIYTKLGVETRTAAMLRAFEIMQQ